MDNVKFVCAWKGSAIPSAKISVKVTTVYIKTYQIIHMHTQVGGLQLEGCSFDGSRLIENQRDSPSLCTVPPATVAWVANDTLSLYSAGQYISLPVYYSSNREKLVTCLDVPLPAGVGLEQWIRCAPAMFLKN